MVMVTPLGSIIGHKQRVCCSRTALGIDLDLGCSGRQVSELDKPGAAPCKLSLSFKQLSKDSTSYLVFLIPKYLRLLVIF